MRNIKVSVLVTVACVLVTGSLRAQTGTGKMQWIGVNGAWASFSTDGGVHSEAIYTSPYKAQFNITTPSTPSPLLPPAGYGTFGPTSDIFCVDFNHYANTGLSNVFFTNLADANANGWFGTYTRPNTLQQYVEAAYLAQKIQAGGDKALYSGAMWQVMTGSAFSYYSGGWQSVQGAVNDAVNAWNANTTGVTLSDWVVVTDQSSFSAKGGYNGNGGQEFITHVTPEPATLLLLGTGLVVMLLGAGALRRPTVL